ncbi:hypothetical protein CMZ84_05740 [Lysobacteraceae bacterium NML93-0399]|nr:hypothetical protein CMZ84_05740 [Xanthomonadaceae bacterium NML93-0399]
MLSLAVARSRPILTLWIGWAGRFLTDAAALPTDGKLERNVRHIACLRTERAAASSRGAIRLECY